MNDSLELQTAVDFVLESEKHIDAAARMARAFPVVQRQIAASMLDELEKKLAAALGSEWEVYNCKNDVFISRYAGFTVWGKSWGKLCLNLENQTRESRTVVGIWRETKPKDSALDDALAKAFAKQGVSGARSRWWVWYKVLPPEYGDWNSAPALSAMRFRQKEIVELLSTEMLSIHRIALPVVAKFVARA